MRSSTASTRLVWNISGSYKNSRLQYHIIYYFQYLGTEARNRSASLTYPSTSKNISLIFFFAWKKLCCRLVVMQGLADLYKMLQRTVLLMRTTTSGLEHTMWTSRAFQTNSQSLWPPQVCQVHAWRMVQCAWHPLKSNSESPHFKLPPRIQPLTFPPTPHPSTTAHLEPIHHTGYSRSFHHSTAAYWSKN